MKIHKSIQMCIQGPAKDPEQGFFAKIINGFIRKTTE